MRLVMAPSAFASFAPATISFTQSTASLRSATCMYSFTRDLVFSSTLSASMAPATATGPESDDVAGVAGPTSAACARSRAASRSCASRLSFSFSVGIAALCDAATYGPESELCLPPPIAARLLDDPALPFLPTISHPSASGNKISSVCAGEMPSAAAASAWISESVIASSFFTRGTQSALRSSMTSRHRKRTRESNFELSSASAPRRAKYISIICFGSLGEASSSLPTVTSRLHNASTFSSGGSTEGDPNKSVTHACRIFSAIMRFLYSSPMSLMLPMVRTLTRFAAAARSAGSAMDSSSSRALPAPSNSSWHVLSRIRRNVTGFPPSTPLGNSGSSLDRRRHTSAYMPQNPGSQMALSNTMEMVSDNVAASSMPHSSSCSIRRSNFSGVILFRIPLIARVVLVLASSVAPRAHAFSALTISAPSVPSGRGVRSTRPPDFFFSDPALAPAADSLPEDTGLSFQSFASLLPSLFSAAAASFLPHCAAAVSSPIASSFTSLITTSRGDVASSTGISEQRWSVRRERGVVGVHR